MAPSRPLGQMRESRRIDCDLCGLRRVCFPARAATGSRRGANALCIRRTRIARGNALYRAGDRIGSLYMVRSGCIKEIDGGGADRDRIVNFRLAGDLLTVQSASAARSRMTCVAVETSFICAVPWVIVEETCAEMPGVIVELINLIARAGAATRDLLTMVRNKGAIERVAGFLLDLGARLRDRGLPGKEFSLGMSRDDIGNYLGLRSETVSRCFSDLERRGLVGVRAKRVRILAIAELQRLFQDESVC